MSKQKGQININWQSRQPVWTWGALCVAGLLLTAMCWAQYASMLNGLERYYLPTYTKTAARAWQSPNNRADYELLYVINRHGQQRLALPNEVDTDEMSDGQTNYYLSDTGLAAGWVRLAFEIGTFNDRSLHGWLGHWIYQDRTLVDYLKWPAYTALIAFLVLAYFGGRKDRERAIALLRGQRLAGTEQVSVAAFNRRMRRRKKIRGPVLDGVVFRDAARSWLARQINSYVSRGVYVPLEREQQHIVMIGDTGQGKSTAIRQTLAQVAVRNEIAVIYDVTGEYVRQFYDPSRGDIILNPLDARCPFYALADEIEDDAEAATLAESLFPERAHEQPFFPEAARSLFSYLLCLQPTPEELLYWLSHPAEIDKRVRGTEQETTLSANAAGQRNGVLASLNTVAKALRLLPREDEVTGRFSTRAWAKERKGWIFITSTPETRVALRPLISLWIDLLVLRILRTGAASGKKTWFIVDEMHSLQRLPQLATALTETRKAHCVMILGFQGRAQIVDLYGPLAEALLSQPATKLFFKTSDPNAAEWISKSIGEVEYLRHRASQSQGRLGQDSESQQQEIVRESLVMDAEIMGLEPLECYLKHGKYAVHLRIEYVEPAENHPAFVQRKRVSVRLRLKDGGAQPPSSAPVSPTQPLTPESPTQQQQQFFE